MSTPVTTVDDYTASLIQEGVVRFYPGLAAKPAPEEAQEEVEAKVVRRGRRPKPAANETAETK